MKLQTIEQSFQEQNTCFYYCGPVLQDGIEGMAQTLLQVLKARGTDMKLAQSVFSVFIEMTQNVMKYSAQQTHVSEDELMRHGSISVLSHQKNEYRILCGNSVTKEDAVLLRAQLDRILPMTKEELRAYYKAKIYDQNNPNPRGAGLGLIEIAKLTSEPMTYTFAPINKQLEYYTLTAVLGGTKHV